MSEYLGSIIRSSGGAGAPAEVLDMDKIEEPKVEPHLAVEEKEELPPPPPGYHYMPDGTLMRDDEHAVRDSLEAAGYLVPEERDLANALLEIVEKHGKFNADNTGVWAGYTSAKENAENAAIGVKCGNCVFWEAPNGCKVIIAETEEDGLCRFAVLPDGSVNPKDKPVEEYFSKSPRLIQEELKKKIKEMENSYKEEYVEISDLTPTQETVDSSNFKDAQAFEKPIIVYKDEEGLKLVDGHHRCATRIRQGHKGIKAKVYQGPIVATAGSKPAEPSERIKGSKKNPKGSAAGGKKITFSKKVESALQEKADNHNKKYGNTASKKTSVRTLKAVYRRGAGAFSTSHRPDQNRNSWAMARVNAYLHLLRTGRPKNSKYTTDNDLLPASHPKSSKKNAASLTAAGYMVELNIKEASTVKILPREEYVSDEHAIFSLAEYSDLSYDIIPSIRASWNRGLELGIDPFERASDLAMKLYDSLDADLLPKKEDE